jgi:hypothetical protein
MREQVIRLDAFGVMGAWNYGKKEIMLGLSTPSRLF